MQIIHLSIIAAAATWLLFVSQPAMAQAIDLFGDPLPVNAQSRLGTVRFRHSGLRGVSFAPDGKSVATAGDDNSIRIWNTSTGQQLREHQGHGLCFKAVRYSPDGALLVGAGGSADSRLYIWDAVTGKELRVIKGVDIHAIAISPDSQRIAWVGLEGSLGIWDRLTGKHQVQTSLFGGTLSSLSFSADGTRIFTAGREHLGVYEATEKRLSNWKNPGGERVRASPDGKYVAVGGSLDHPLFLLDADTGKTIRELPVGRLIRAFEFSHDGKSLICEGSDSVVTWDVARGVPIDMIPIGSRQLIEQIAISSNDKTLAIASGASLLIVDRISKRSSSIGEVHDDWVRWARFLKSGEVITAASDGTLRIWDATTGRCKRRIETCRWQYDLALSPDQKLVAWSNGIRDYSIRLHDLDTGEFIRRFPPLEITPRHLTFSPDGKHLAATDGDVRIHVWEIASGKRIKTIKGKAGWAHVSYLPTTGQMLAGDAGELKILDAQSGKTMKTIEVANNGIVVSRDAKLFATFPQLHEDHISIVEIETGNVVKKVVDETGIGALAIAMSRDGKLLAYGRGFKAEIVVLEIATGKRIAVFQGHKGYITSLDFSHDGTRLVSSSGDATALVWRLPNHKAD